MMPETGNALLPSAAQSFAAAGPNLFWLAALVAALAYAVRSAHLSRLDTAAMYWAGVGAILCGLWGAHVLVVLQHPSANATAFLQVWVGGKAFYGGLGGGAFAFFLCLSLRGLPVLAYADAAAPAVALGYAIGRIGCFVNGDDYGTLSSLPWVVRFPAGTEAHAAHVARGWINATDAWSLAVHPTQLYASTLGFLLFLTPARRHTGAPGSRFCLYAVVYGTARFFMEWLRGDFRAVLGPFSLPQLCSLILVSWGLVTWSVTRRPIKGRLLSRESPREVSGFTYG